LVNFSKSSDRFHLNVQFFLIRLALRPALFTSLGPWPCRAIIRISRQHFLGLPVNAKVKDPLLASLANPLLASLACFLDVSRSSISLLNASFRWDFVRIIFFAGAPAGILLWGVIIVILQS
jgi:hypothetical protein